MLGTPSTVATVSGEAFYYISQKGREARRLHAAEVVDQRVIAVYFDKNRRVATARRLRHEGRQDVRLHQPHHADRRPGTVLPHLHVQDSASLLQSVVPKVEAGLRIGHAHDR